MVWLVIQSQTFCLECEVKWTLRNTVFNQTSGCDEIPAELFRSLKDDVIKVLHSLYQQIWKTQQWPQDQKKSILIPVPKKASTKECANHRTVALISYACKVMLKIVHARLQDYVNKNLRMSKLGLEKEEELEIKLPAFTGLQRKQGNFRKTSLFHLLGCAKAFDCMAHDKLWKALREMRIPVS